MTGYTIRRVGQGIIVVIAVTLITFFEAHLVPGNPARAILGMHASSARIAAFDRHIVPNTIGTIMVNATFQVAGAILALAALSFLGLGIPPPAVNWGQMLSSGVTYIYAGAWWLIYPPGVAILLTVMAVNSVGDSLRDSFGTRLRRR